MYALPNSPLLCESFKQPMQKYNAKIMYEKNFYVKNNRKKMQILWSRLCMYYIFPDICIIHLLSYIFIVHKQNAFCRLQARVAADYTWISRDRVAIQD